MTAATSINPYKAPCADPAGTSGNPPRIGNTFCGLQPHWVRLNVVGQVPAFAVALRVWVHSNDAQQAREVIAGLIADRDEQRSQWMCPQCGELNEPSFDMCWNCQAERN